MSFDTGVDDDPIGVTRLRPPPTEMPTELLAGPVGPVHTTVAKPGIDWLGIGEAILRNRLLWLVSGSLVFAVSPLVAWIVYAATDGGTLTDRQDGAPAAVADSSAEPAPDPAPPPAGPSARFGGTPDDASAADGCHPSYSGCVPIAEDVDCVGGQGEAPHGDGPAFVSGPLLVIGDDVYELDPNDDHVACYDGDG